MAGPTTKELLHNIVQLHASLEAKSDDQAPRLRLLDLIDSLHRDLRKPNYTCYRDYADMARIKSAATLLQHDVLQAIPSQGYIGAAQLAKHSKLDEVVIVRLMRNLTAQGIIRLGPGEEAMYAHTHLSRFWLQQGGPEWTIVMDREVSGLDLGAYFQTHGLENMERPDRCPAVSAAGEQGSDFFEILSRDDRRLRDFRGAMEFRNEMLPVGLIYPFDQLVDPTYHDDMPLIVDVGGGNGQAMIALKRAFPGLRGRMIVQDRPEVIDSFSEDRASSIVKMKHDFFEGQPVQSIEHTFSISPTRH